MAKILIQSTKDPKRTRAVSARDAGILVKLGRWEYQTTALEGGPPRRRKRKPEPAPAAAPAEPQASPEPPAPEPPAAVPQPEAAPGE